MLRRHFHCKRFFDLEALCDFKPHFDFNFDFKRLFDVVLAAAGLVLLGPVLLVIAGLIQVDSGGPVLFRQRRVGRGLRCFTLLKFRSMIPCHGGGEITVADDHRVTRLGRLLRLAKLDELPQLWNILAGDMSFVGPRPLVESTVNQFREDYRRILANARPGITDPASIKYRHESAILGACAEPVDYYYQVIMPDKIRLQKAYLRGQSVLGDVRILCHTLVACCLPEAGIAEGKLLLAADRAADSAPYRAALGRPQAAQAVDLRCWDEVGPARPAAFSDEPGFSPDFTPDFLPDFSGEPDFAGFPAFMGESGEPHSWEMDAR